MTELFNNKDILWGRKDIEKFLCRSWSTIRTWKQKGLPLHYDLAGRPFIIIAEILIYFDELDKLRREAQKKNKKHEKT